MKIELTLPKTAFIGAALCAPKNDVRYYLQGVCLQIRDNHIYTIATDGLHLIAQHHGSAISNCGKHLDDLEIIIPLDAIKSIKKPGKKDLPNLIVTIDLVNNFYMLGNIVFTPIEGKYPDWRRVLPDQIKIRPHEDQPNVQVNTHLLNNLETAFLTIRGLNPKSMDARCALVKDTIDPATPIILHDCQNDLMGVVMPVRLKNESTWKGLFKP